MKWTNIHVISSQHPSPSASESVEAGFTCPVGYLRVKCTEYNYATLNVIAEILFPGLRNNI